MRVVQHNIAERQSVFRRHAFFTRFRPGAPHEQVLSFAPGLMFWVFAFQDILRLNHLHVHDPVLRKISAAHRRDDAGQDRWFLHDLRALGMQDTDLSRLFGADHQATRDASYALISEIYRASDDRVRIAFVLTLESVGHVFFERSADYIDGTGLSPGLRYFASAHYCVEQSKGVFPNAGDAELERIVLPDDVRAEAIGMITRVYRAFHAMFDGLHATSRLAFTQELTMTPGLPQG